jgi:3-oxoacyl-[acyl-carrier protein] reductase
MFANRDPLGFSGKTVLVVGGSGQIGNGIARAFLNAHADVFVWGTRPTATDYADDEGADLSGLRYAQVDVSDFAAVVGYDPPFHALDVLVLCQGTVVYKRGEFRIDNFHRVVDVNLNSLMACAERFHDYLAASKGSLITVSSTAAFRSARGNPAYSASKAGVVALTRTLAEAWAPEGIRVNGIAPGIVDTKLTKVITENPKRVKGVLDEIPVGRLGTPQDMAGVVLFLASPLARYVVGQTIVVDGGLLL